MILFWFLCVCLLLVGLALCTEVRAALGDLWLHCFGVRVRVRRLNRQTGSVAPRSPPHDRLPPPRVITRSGP
jgi:hypothetical protein